MGDPWNGQAPEDFTLTPDTIFRSLNFLKPVNSLNYTCTIGPVITGIQSTLACITSCVYIHIYTVYTVATMLAHRIVLVRFEIYVEVLLLLGSISVLVPSSGMVRLNH